MKGFVFLKFNFLNAWLIYMGFWLFKQDNINIQIIEEILKFNINDTVLE